MTGQTTTANSPRADVLIAKTLGRPGVFPHGLHDGALERLDSDGPRHRNDLPPAISPGEPWDLGHDDDHNRSLPSQPEHRGCNRATTKRYRRTCER